MVCVWRRRVLPRSPVCRPPAAHVPHVVGGWNSWTVVGRFPCMPGLSCPTFARSHAARDRDSSVVRLRRTFPTMPMVGLPGRGIFVFQALGRCVRSVWWSGGMCSSVHTTVRHACAGRTRACLSRVAAGHVTSRSRCACLVFNSCPRPWLSAFAKPLFYQNPLFYPSTFLPIHCLDERLAEVVLDVAIGRRTSREVVEHDGERKFSLTGT